MPKRNKCNSDVIYGSILACIMLAGLIIGAYFFPLRRNTNNLENQYNHINNDYDGLNNNSSFHHQLKQTPCTDHTCFSTNINALRVVKCDSNTCSQLSNLINQLNQSKCSNTTCSLLQTEINSLNQTKCSGSTCSLLQTEIDHLNQTKCSNSTCSLIQTEILSMCLVSTCS